VRGVLIADGQAGYWARALGKKLPETLEYGTMRRGPKAEAISAAQLRGRGRYCETTPPPTGCARQRTSSAKGRIEPFGGPRVILRRNE
jgi:hypothetical protein